MKETFNLPVIRYRDTDGKPTCYANEGVCQFVVAKDPHGRKHLCFWDRPTYAAKSIRRRSRRGDGLGSLIPIDKCPLWEGEER